MIGFATGYMQMQKLPSCFFSKNRYNDFSTFWVAGFGTNFQRGLLMPVEETEKNPYKCSAIDPKTGKDTLILTLSKRKIEMLGRRGNRGDIQRVLLVRDTLLHPSGIFSGIRFEEDEEHSCDAPGWLCYCSLPIRDFTRSGEECNPPYNKVFLVFVNDEEIVYNWYWETCDLEKPQYPKNFQERFKEIEL
ncbi:MAG: hypothetical protein ACRC10_03775 [Thermoguttaceae bacterium]